MDYITSTQLRTKSKELVDALSDGQAVTLIHRSRVIGVIKPIDPDDPDLPESSSLDQQRATTQTKNPEAATLAANQPAEHDDHPMIERVEPASEPAIEENTRPTQTSYNQVDDDFLASPVAQAVQDVHHDLQAPDTGEQSQDAVTVVTDTQQLPEDRYIEQRYQGGFEGQPEPDDAVGLEALPTISPAIKLIPLKLEHGHLYYQLVDENRQHLTALGDYQEMHQLALEDVLRELQQVTDHQLRFGIWHEGQMVGRVDLNLHRPGVCSIGYWLSRRYTGQGIATMACQAVLEFARDHLGAATIYAGVTKGNHPSQALLRRIGFTIVEDRGDYLRYRLDLTES